MSPDSTASRGATYCRFRRSSSVYRTPSSISGKADSSETNRSASACPASGYSRRASNTPRTGVSAGEMLEKSDQ